MIGTALEAGGILLATIDMPDRTMNVFSSDLMEALHALMERVEADPDVRAVVLTSGKSSFLAGADLVMVQGYCAAARTDTAEQMFSLCGRLGRLFVALEQSPKPWVAAVNGLALGGGLELALACRERLVAEDPKIQLGVPEVRWGLLPGAGGTQRLPRLAGFEPAMGLLLTGRSMTPAEALALGVVNTVVPPAQLLDAARARALALQEQPYDAAAKFRHLAQRDVPPHSAATARDVARRHGVVTEDFDLYPAYSAIVDSVLLGARLPLAEATAVEMRQFLRLMFSPVAGRMIRTLFLERLRAEKELAAPQGLGIDRIVHGPLGEPNAAWSQALARLKLPVQLDPALPADTLVLTDTRGATHRMAMCVLASPARTGPSMLLAPSGPYGRVLEAVGVGDAAAAAAAALAASLRALPWRTPGPTSVLRQLHGRPLVEQARIARACADAPGATDPVFLDIAACLAGVSPAWSGGPLMWAADTQGATATP